MSDKKTPLCIKLDKDVRSQFKKVTHERHTTMQNVLEGFVDFYIVNPQAVSVKNNTSLEIDKGVAHG